MVGLKPFEVLTRAEITALAPMSKHGSGADGTDAAHKMSIELFQSIIGTLTGRHMTDIISQKITAKLLQSEINLRMKTVHGNRATDRLLDRRIKEKLASGDYLNGREARRAVQANKSADRLCRVMSAVLHNIPSSYKHYDDICLVSKVIHETSQRLGSLNVNTNDLGCDTVAELVDKLKDELEKVKDEADKNKCVIKTDNHEYEPPSCGSNKVESTELTELINELELGALESELVEEILELLDKLTREYDNINTLEYEPPSCEDQQELDDEELDIVLERLEINNDVTVEFDDDDDIVISDALSELERDYLSD